MPHPTPLTDRIHAELAEARAVLDRFLADDTNLARIAQAAELMADCLKNGGKILTCGNGGSLCDAQHFAEELSGRYRADRRALAAIALTDASHMTCVANDYGFEFVFSRLWRPWAGRATCCWPSVPAATRPTCCAPPKPPGPWA